MPPRKERADAASSPSSGDRPSRGRKELVEGQIFESAVSLFAERGFAGTSLQDIAEAAGLTRPALYYYFSSKNDLLARLVRELTTDVAERLIAIANNPDLDASATVRELVRVATRSQMTTPDHFRLMLRSEAELPAELVKTYDEGRRSVLRIFVSTIDEGIDSGHFRSVDARTAALGIIGMVNWVAWWYRPEDAGRAGDIADEIAEMAVASLRADVQRPVGGRSTAQVVDMLREDLALLERSLKSAGN